MRNDQIIRVHWWLVYAFQREPAFSFLRNSALFVVKTFFFERILIPAFREVRGEELGYENVALKTRFYRIVVRIHTDPRNG